MSEGGEGWGWMGDNGVQKYLELGTLLLMKC